MSLGSTNMPGTSAALMLLVSISVASVSAAVTASLLADMQEIKRRRREDEGLESDDVRREDSSAPDVRASKSVGEKVSLCKMSKIRRPVRCRECTYKQNNTGSRCGGYEGLIGNTPLVRLDRLSSLLGRQIYVKMECMNPGGTGKDRAALAMLRHAEQNGHLPSPNQRGPRGIVVEGSSGSTGISLAALCASRGHDISVVMPDDQSSTKVQLLKRLGATVKVVPNVAFSNPNHYVNVARRMAQDLQENKENKHLQKMVYFVDQFDNAANAHAHYQTTGPEIWHQLGCCCCCNDGCHQEMPGRIDVFVMSAGTGGTISGVGRYLKERRRRCSCQEKEQNTMSHSSTTDAEITPSPRVVLVDPPGSSFFSTVRYGITYTPEQSERSLQRHRYDTLAEGIGCDRLTQNFALGHHSGLFDDAICVGDQEAVDMAHWLLQEEGLFVGSSTAMNLVGAVEEAKKVQKGGVVVTLVCDGGQRHLQRFWRRGFVVEDRGLIWPGDAEAVECDEGNECTSEVGGLRRRIPRCLMEFFEADENII